MAYFERDDEPRARGWRDLILSLATVGALAAGLVLSGCASSIPDIAQLFQEVTLGKPAPSDENLVNKGYAEIEAGNYSYAEIYLDSALSINPSNPFALLNMAVVYEKTGREDEARALYAALIRQNPTNIADSAIDDANVGRIITDIARENLAALDRAVIARAARNADSPIEVSLEPVRQNLESDWRSRMDERISILQDLFAEGFISEDELMARLGGAWSRSHADATPDISEIMHRMETLESLLTRGMISSQSYAVERGYVLDELAPIMAMPAGQSSKPEDRLDERAVIDRIFVPLEDSLRALHRHDLTHRTVRPDNLYCRDRADGPVGLGECLSAPPGFDQPDAFEPIESAMASPAGRGVGSPASDMFALGVTIVTLLSGRWSAQQHQPQRIMRRIERGSYREYAGVLRCSSDMEDCLPGSSMTIRKGAGTSINCAPG